MLKRFVSVLLAAFVLAGSATILRPAVTALAAVQSDGYVPVLPKIKVPAKKIVVVDLSIDKNVNYAMPGNVGDFRPNHAGAEALVAISVIQGIVNRYSEEKIYLTSPTLTWSYTWDYRMPGSRLGGDVAKSALQIGMIPADVEIEYATLDETKEFPALYYLMDRYAYYLNGVVKIYSANLDKDAWGSRDGWEWRDSGSTMLGFMACAHEDAVPVTPNIERFLRQEFAGRPGIMTKLDNVILDTTVDEFRDGIASFNYAYDRYAPVNNPDTATEYIAKWSFNDWGAPGSVLPLQCLDYFIATKAFIIDLNANNAAESDLMAKIINNANYAPGAPILGAADGEGAELERIYALGHTFSFFDGANFSVHSSFPCDPSELEPSTPKAADTIDPNGAYVAFYVSDGDAFYTSQYTHEFYYEQSILAGSNQEDVIPIGWSIPPLAFDLYPNLFYWRTHNTYNGKYELIGNYSDGNSPYTADGRQNFLDMYKYYLDNTNGIFQTINYYEKSKAAENDAAYLNPPVGVIMGYQGNYDSGSGVNGNETEFYTINNGNISKTTVSGQTQGVPGQAGKVAQAANIAINAYGRNTPAFVIVAAGDGAHSGDVAANLKRECAALTAQAAQPGGNGRNYYFMTPSDLFETWKKWYEEENTTLVDDTDPAISYTDWGSDWRDEKLNGGSGHYSYMSGAPTLEYSFEGTGIQWITKVDGTVGKAEVFIDGASQGIIDLKNSRTIYNYSVFEVKGLKNGPHTIKIVSADLTKAIGVDAFRVFNVKNPAGDDITYGYLVDDSDPGIRYNGTWGSWDNPKLYGGWARYSWPGGSPSLEYTFTGTGIQWISATDSTSRTANVYVDDMVNVYAVVDVCAVPGTNLYQYPLWEIRDLPYGTHTIKIEPTGDTVTRGLSVSVDAFRVFTETKWKASNASASSTSFEYWGLYNPPENAIDGKPDTMWMSDIEGTKAGEAKHFITDNPIWWQMDLGEARRISGFELDFRRDGSGAVIPPENTPGERSNFKVEGSNDPDFLTGVVLLAGQGATVCAKDSWIAYSSDDVNAYRYIRVSKTEKESGNGGDDIYFSIVDFTAWFDPRIASPEPEKPEPDDYYVDDKDARVRYSGMWGRWDEDPLNYDGTIAYSSYDGTRPTSFDSAELTFTGTGIEWIGQKASWYGKANVYIDGVPEASDVDLYSPGVVYQTVLFSKTGMPYKEHTIRIVETGTKNPANNDWKNRCLITVDAFHVIIDFPEGPPPIAPEAMTRTDTSIRFTPAAGVEYSLDNWSGSNITGVFTGLQPNTAYTLRSRIASAGSETSQTVRTKAVISLPTVDGGGGSVSADKAYADAGEFVTYTLTADKGMAAEKIVVNGTVYTAPTTVNSQTSTFTYMVRTTDGGAITAAAYFKETGTIPPEPDDYYIDDKDPRVKYSGMWGRWDVDPLNYDSTITYSSYDGTRPASHDSAELTFTGTGIEWIGQKAGWYGKANVYIDGVLEAPDVDLYSPGVVYQTVLFSKTGMPYGEHTIRIVETGTRNPANNDWKNRCLITVDAFHIFTGLPGDATLANLEVAGFGISPDFDPAVTEYTLIVGNAVQYVTILAQTNNVNAKVTGDIGEVSLDVGDNTFYVAVAAENGGACVYTITVTRRSPDVFIITVKSMLAKIAKPQQIPFIYEGPGPVEFMSSNTAVCNVTPDGILLPLKAGIAVITVSAPGFPKYVFAVTVTA